VILEREVLPPSDKGRGGARQSWCF